MRLFQEVKGDTVGCSDLLSCDGSDVGHRGGGIDLQIERSSQKTVEEAVRFPLRDAKTGYTCFSDLLEVHAAAKRSEMSAARTL